MGRLFNLWIIFWVAVASLGIAWEESCGNPAFFCYRIGREIFLQRAAMSSLAAESPQVESWNSSGKLFTRSTMFKG